MLALCNAALADCVVLLHGLARSAGSMDKMASVLIASGYDVVNVDYPSTEHTVQYLADTSIDSGLSRCAEGATVHFVTHSLGGILVRQYLSRREIPGLGRVVMLGPPNQGSEVVDALGDVPGFELINGVAGTQLGTGEASVPRQLGPANFDVGIIAGTRSINLILSAIIPGSDDGKVSVENARLEGMNDFITLPVSHPFLMKDDEVIRQIIYYLRHGEFDRKPAASHPGLLGSVTEQRPAGAAINRGSRYAGRYR
jgi:pimeloyl-ACP methyl ester carboxylesterase